MSEHEQVREEEGGEREEIEDLDVPAEESEDVKGGLGSRERPERNIN